MSLITATGIALILSTVIYHGGLAFLYARAHFAEALTLSRGERLFIIAKYPKQYVLGFRIVLVGWILSALAYVMLTVILRDAGDQIVSTLALVLFLIAIVLGNRLLGACSADNHLGCRGSGPHRRRPGIL